MPSSGGATATATGGATAAATAGQPAEGDANWEHEPNLEALGVSNARLDQTTGSDLLDLAEQIGLARGYAQCACLAPESVEDGWVGSCAAAETALPGLIGGEMERRCLSDLAQSLSTFDDYLRCKAKSVRDSGRFYATCAPDDPRPPIEECEDLVPATWEPGQNPLLGQACEYAFYCADGSFHQTGRCDVVQDCPNLDDERNCDEVVSGDTMVHCEDLIVPSHGVCRAGSCSALLESELCQSEVGFGTFQCKDGTNPHSGAVCDGTDDCPEGEDEFAGIDFAECLD